MATDPGTKKLILVVLYLATSLLVGAYAGHAAQGKLGRAINGRIAGEEIHVQPWAIHVSAVALGVLVSGILLCPLLAISATGGPLAIRPQALAVCLVGVVIGWFWFLGSGLCLAILMAHCAHGEDLGFMILLLIGPIFVAGLFWLLLSGICFLACLFLPVCLLDKWLSSLARQERVEYDASDDEGSDRWKGGYGGFPM